MTVWRLLGAAALLVLASVGAQEEAVEVDQAHIAKVDDQAEGFQSQIKSLSAQVDSLKAQVKTEASRADTEGARADREASKAQKAEGRARTAEEELQRVREESKGTTVEIGRLSRRADDAEAKTETLRDEFSSARARVKELEGHVSEKDGEIASLKKDAEARGKDAQGLKQEVERMKGEKADLEKKLKAEQAEKASIQAELKKLQDKLSSAKAANAERDSLKARVAELETELDAKYTPVALLGDARKGASLLGSFVADKSVEYAGVAAETSRPHLRAAGAAFKRLIGAGLESMAPVYQNTVMKFYDEKLREHVEPHYRKHVAPAMGVMGGKMRAFWVEKGKPGLIKAWTAVRAQALKGSAAAQARYGDLRARAVWQLNAHPKIGGQGEGVVLLMEYITIALLVLALWKPFFNLVIYLLLLPFRILAAPFTSSKPSTARKGKGAAAKQKPTTTPAHQQSKQHVEIKGGQTAKVGGAGGGNAKSNAGAGKGQQGKGGQGKR